MSEMLFSRSSPLAEALRPGRYGAVRGAPSVVLGIRHPLSIATVIARARKDKAVAKALAGVADVSVQWAGPDQYFVIAKNRGEGALYRELKAALDGLAAVSDQSHGRIVIRVEGPKSRAVLSKGTPVDLHADVFPVGKSAMTQMAHVGVHLTCVGEDSFDLSVFRGFSESFWEWLTEQSREFGYLVR